MAKFKRRLILALAAVFSFAGVFSLFPSPTLASPISPATCRIRAEDIQARVEEDALEADITNTFGNTCPNFCKAGEPGENISGEAFLRVPGQNQAPPSAGEGVLTSTRAVYPGGEVLYGLTPGRVAFFCADGSVVLAVNQPGPDVNSGMQAACGVFKALCTDP